MSGLYFCQGRENVSRLICVIKGGRMDVGHIVLSRWDEWWRAYSVVKGERRNVGANCQGSQEEC
jgi:hypothetical protein